MGAVQRKKKRMYLTWTMRSPMKGSLEKVSISVAQLEVTLPFHESTFCYYLLSADSPFPPRKKKKLKK
jgi:hypothetical protein